MKTHYDVLGLNKDATDQEIKKAYRKLAMKFHPDRNQNNPEATEKFQEISSAYQVLSDEDEKTKYDQELNFVSEEAPATADSFEENLKENKDNNNYTYSEVNQFPMMFDITPHIFESEVLKNFNFLLLAALCQSLERKELMKLFESLDSKEFENKETRCKNLIVSSFEPSSKLFDQLLAF